MVFNCKYCIYQYLTARNILMAKPITRIVSVNHSQKGENEVHSMFLFFVFCIFHGCFKLSNNCIAPLLEYLFLRPIV